MAFDMPSDDAYIISASYDKTIRKWDPALRENNSKVIRKTKQQTISLAVSPVAEMIAVSTYGQCNELLDANTGETIALLERPEHTWTLRFTPDGKCLYGGCHDGSVCYWDIDDLFPDGGKVRQVVTLPYHEIKGAQMMGTYAQRKSSQMLPQRHRLETSAESMITAIALGMLLKHWMACEQTSSRQAFPHFDKLYTMTPVNGVVKTILH
ncbi:hypothetical protein FRB99_004603 [Tulasnella sp. 403]|nr:hypothetical protein FRB99_004603 [Tulasnella sp. 403]